MATRQINKLSHRQAEALKIPGKYMDGDGLILQINPKGGKSWIYRYRWAGKVKELGLGSYKGLNVKQAREAADAARKQARTGNDPKIEKRLAVAEKAEMPTFGTYGLRMIDKWQSGWKNPKHIAQW